jgi:hypothetical protein
MATATETSANCGASIGKLETPHLWSEQIVCAACYKKLAGELTTRADTIDYGRHPAAKGDVQLIEQTGKRWKFHQLLAGGLASVGLVMVAGAIVGEVQQWSLAGSLMLVGWVILCVGFVWLAIARTFAWWHHG